MKPRVVAIVGPTAAGKSSIAIEVAERVDAEIVSIDSMQIYRGMDIGTDKVTPEMRARVPHHLIDANDPKDCVTVAEFQRLARAAVTEIVDRGRLPLLVGGSGLYFRAVVDDLEFPPTDAAVRTRLQREADESGAETLHARLAQLDPVAAGRIEPSNVRRTIRALEAIELTGRPFSENQSWNRYDSVYDLTAVGLERRREELDARIAGRVATMLERGLVEEVTRLGRDSFGPTAKMGLGYRQVLEAPQASSSELEERIVRATRKFARRQESWFRADPRVAWVDAEEDDVVERVIAALEL